MPEAPGGANPQCTHNAAGAAPGVSLPVYTINIRLPDALVQNSSWNTSKRALKKVCFEPSCNRQGAVFARETGPLPYGRGSAKIS